ncbi:MAG: sialate O-acetylesterase [Filimonas sp.]|nr:sialate O-acetylesterase [Filimonas sp.]
MRNKILLSFLLVALVKISFANITLPAIINNNMVLQQNKAITLWGWATPGETVTVTGSWDNKTTKTVTDKNGNWKVNLTTTKAGGPYTLTFNGKNTISLDNVLLGEVWLCSGQSNMQFPLAKQKTGWQNGVFNYEKEVSEANYKNIRLFTVKPVVSDTVCKDVTGNWQECDPATAAPFAAVAYYFARSIYKETGYPVGLVSSNWGGTPAESWTKKEVLENDPALKVILEKYNEQLAQYPAQLEQYKKQVDAWKADTSKTKKAAPKEPFAANNPKSPYKLYNAMIAPITNFTFSGVIWYQGESNSDRAYQYQTLFPAMINSWRKEFNNKELPFYFVQISPQYAQHPEIREAQLLTYEKMPHTGMVVTTDNGDSLNIHPRNKQLVGERLSLWPLHDMYGKKTTEYSGPLYQSAKTEGNKIRISFTHAVGMYAKGEVLKEFTIAGSDEKFVPASAKIEGNTIVVWSDAVVKPVAVRFAWKNFPQPNLYNKANLPASPFKTDNWKWETEGKVSWNY